LPSSGRQFRVCYRKDDISKINRLKSDPRNLIIDLRSRGSFAAVHIPGTRNVPYEVFRSEIPRIAPQKQTPIYLICASGEKSYQAAIALERMGYTNVTDFGAISGYRGSFTT